MDKHTARGLSMGFFITGIVLLLFKSVLAPAQTTAEEPVVDQEAIEIFLKANNLLVISEEDLTALQNGQAEEEPNKEETTEAPKEEKAKTEEKAEEKEEEEKEEEKEEEPVTHKIKITAGMVSPDVAKLLKEKGLIENESKFVQRVESKNAAKYVQIGTHELKTGMNHDEIIQVITKGRAQ